VRYTVGRSNRETPGVAVRRKLGTACALSTLVLTCLVGCGKDEKTALPAPTPSKTTDPSPTSTGPSFSMPSPGDEIGAEVTAQPPDDESSDGAALFSAWALSLLLHTPRESASTELWLQASAAGCDPCRSAAGAWQQQRSKGQVFQYARTPHFLRTVVRAQPQGDGWFVQFEAAVPRSTLRQDGRVLESSDAENLGYTFRATRVDDQWRIDDFHVLG
jgi:hypothetical protein